jgi:hypothetical protein
MGDVAKIFTAGLWLLSGFVYIYTSYYRRFAWERLKTDRFALFALACSFVIYLIGAAFSRIIPDWTPKWFEAIRDEALNLGVSAAVFNALIVGALAGMAENYLTSRALKGDSVLSAYAPQSLWGCMRFAAREKFVRKSNDALLRLLFRATVMKKYVQVTMKSNKVYVGGLRYVEFDPSLPLTSINVLPTRSGYRDPTTKRVTYSTLYEDIADHLTAIPQEETEGEPIELTAEDVEANPLTSDLMLLEDVRTKTKTEVDIVDLGVVLPISEIASVSIFDDAIYRWFQDKPRQMPQPILRWRERFRAALQA